MTINPVPGTSRSDESVIVSPVVRTNSSAASQSKTVSGAPDSGTRPKAEIPDSNNVSAAAEMSQDEVCVQRDSSPNGQIVIKYLDSEGNLILQIPSTQVLGLAKAIEQALQDGAESIKQERPGSQKAEGGKF